MIDACINPFFGRIAALHGARSVAYQRGMSRSLRAMRLALHPKILDLCRHRTLALFLLLCLAFSFAHAEDEAPAASAGWGLPQLMQSLAQVQSSKAKFKERKYLAVLIAPLDSSGTLLFQAPGHLEKHTLKPKAESLVLDQGVLTIDSKARNIKRTLVLQEYPAVWAFVESIRSTLAGDLPTLQRFYKVSLKGNAGKWSMLLIPLEQRTRQVMSEIVISGRGARVTHIETTEPNGDHSTMTIIGEAP
jgi:hypothetical protein